MTELLEHDRSEPAVLDVLLTMPSFYGAVAWCIWLPLYQARLVEWERASSLALVVFWTTAAAFVACVLTTFPLYRETRARRAFIPRKTQGSSRYLPALHLVGFLGLALYVRAIASALGGLKVFFAALLAASYLIRWQFATVSSVGTQLSYFGWIAIALTLYERQERGISRWWYAAALVQFAGNLLFIDRTRPLWILFTTGCVVLAIRRGRGATRLVLWGAAAVAAIVGVFVVIAMWVGKVAQTGDFGTSPLPLPLQGFYVYGTAGFAYFDAMLRGAEHISFAPSRTLYPISMVLSALHLSPPPPSQILDYYFAPFPTNVGTFLEPFYRDGGLMYVAVGLIVHTLGLDLLGVWLLRSAKPFALYAWASLAFVNVIGFFTPKITNVPIWLFVGLGVLAALRLQRSPVAVSESVSPARA